MKYRESKVDKDLRLWFGSDMSKALLRRICVVKGNLRGVSSMDISLNYPITAFAGVNGAGKSTILALASCAYHANKDAFKAPRRKHPYYTFSDFFIRHREEAAPDGIEIRYTIANDKWKKSESFPEGRGLGVQERRKNKGGKWNDYASRVKKTVVFLGIERIVPHSERSQSRSYSRSFADVKPKGWEGKVRDAVGFILGKTYDDFRYLEHSRYSLPLVKVGDITYSGFNMGAGENALFEIFSTIYSCGERALLVMDEIELGLHAKAQKLFMKKLKEVCKETGTQVICTTHSREIFECLPDDARFFVETIGGKTKLTGGISPDFAFAKMGAQAGNELEILVEDDVGKSLLQAAFSASIRTRVTIKVIGSATAIARQLAACYVRKDDRAIIAIFDGDQQAKDADNFGHAKNMAENPGADFEEWYRARIDYLPGATWPESWIVQKAREVSDDTAGALAVDPEAVEGILEYGLQAGKHNEFYEIAQNVGLSRSQCIERLCATVCTAFPDAVSPLVRHIEEILG
ncbi:AAA family ATPase [Alcaligenes sp. AB3]|uniref:ATP-dependent nuclease n=1 Tax=Alcaligenes sp. AB3 TaxID=2962569 RepID=UPI002882CFF9|nr:AAA family ATPase [Alcaligenes sp. AB3]MDT0216761.1 AAA family ATPase [Alcaligenes sp. AB3]